MTAVLVINYVMLNKNENDIFLLIKVDIKLSIPNSHT